jgi:hypothetical protein
MYIQLKNQLNNQIENLIIRTTDGACIPFDNANSDFAQFKKDLANGAELQDAEGNVINGIAYLEELV